MRVMTGPSALTLTLTLILILILTMLVLLPALAASPTGLPEGGEAIALPSGGRILRVGPNQPYLTPSQAALEARDGDLVEIAAGPYPGDVASWGASDLTLRGVGGLARLESGGRVAEEKAIWVIKGDNVVVENIAFIGARARHRNGAGIRHEGTGLTIRGSLFRDNENGILTGANPDNVIRIENSEFAESFGGHPESPGQSHNIYVGRIARLELVNNVIHDAIIGHNVKSRARENLILYNRILDRHQGSSYLIDLSEGGNGIVLGNLLRQGPKTDNSALIAYAPEGNRQRPDQYLLIVNNTLVNDLGQGIFVYNHSIAPVLMVNNILAGSGQPLVGPGRLNDNLLEKDPRFVDPASFDYRLRPGSPAIDAGREPGRSPQGLSLVAQSEPSFPMTLQPRPRVGPLDLGAYEYRD